MSSKPGTIPTWDSTVANVSTPASLQQTNGYQTNDVPTSAVWNFLFYWIYQWIQYISDGVFTGNMEVTGNLKVDGTTQLVGALEVDAGIHASGGGPATFPNGLTSSAEISGTSVGFTSGVVVNVSTFNSTDDPTRSGGTHTRAIGKWTFTGTSVAIYYPIDFLQSGDVITSYTVGITKSGTSNVVHVGLVSQAAGSDTALTAGNTSSLTVGPQIIGEPSLTLTTSGIQYAVKVSPGDSGDAIGDVKVTFHRP